MMDRIEALEALIAQEGQAMTDVGELIDRLQSQLVMSMFCAREGLYREQEQQREQAAEALTAQQQRIEELEGALRSIANIGIAVSVRSEVQIAEARGIARAALNKEGDG